MFYAACGRPTRPVSYRRERPTTVKLAHPVLYPRLVGFAGAAFLATALSGCSTIGDLFSGDKVDYRSTTSNRAQPLEVPPDLSQLSRDSRYQPQGGVVSAAAAAAGPAVVAGTLPATAAVPAVALTQEGDIRVERAGQQRWLVVPLAPEQLWPRLKSFWQEHGFTLAEENAKTGVMETDWSENRAKLPSDAVRNTIGRVLGNLYDTGERDRFRTRVERTAAGAEIYISHRGAAEVYADDRRETTTWRTRPNDPQLEAEFLSRLMVALGAKDAPARAAVVAAGGSGTPPPLAGRAGERAAALPIGATSLQVSDAFDRAWRRVGLALDRGGFTVEDRDRTAGLYYVRYVDPKSVGKEEPGWWSRLFGSSANPQAAVRYRIAVKSSGELTTVSVQNSAGAPDAGENAQRIVALLGAELR